MERLEQLREYYKKNETEILKDFFTFLKFKSISSEAKYSKDCKSCSDWLVAYLKTLHFETEVWESRGHPVIFASNLNAGQDKPTLLIYNHYDVQPFDPLELWESNPFEPEIRADQIFARGAQDNKGQCFYTLQALKYLIQNEKLPINIKLCIEGEEECGSNTLSKFINEKKEELKADYLAVVDLGIRSLEKPSISLGIRGMISMDLNLKGANTDMHSGTNGGLLYNPNHALVAILASLRDANGKILVQGFYDDVEPMSLDDKKWISFDFDENEYLRVSGVKPTGGENNYSPLERNWIRPTMEINGISGGYSGSGFKTVIPSEASAKISCRLVPNQDPIKIAALIEKHFQKNTPSEISVTVDFHRGSPALQTNPTSKIVQTFKKAYEEVFNNPTDFIYEGASIPIITELGIASSAEVVLVGLGLPDDAIHAPNEHFGLNRLEKGFLIMTRAIELLDIS